MQSVGDHDPVRWCCGELKDKASVDKKGVCVYLYVYGESWRETINYCPWCGKKLV